MTTKTAKEKILVAQAAVKNYDYSSIPRNNGLFVKGWKPPTAGAIAPHYSKLQRVQLEIDEALGKNRPYANIWRDLYDMGHNGNWKAYALLLSYRLGIPKQTLELDSTNTNIDYAQVIQALSTVQHEQANQVHEAEFTLTDVTLEDKE